VRIAWREAPWAFRRTRALGETIRCKACRAFGSGKFNIPSIGGAIHSRIYMLACEMSTHVCPNLSVRRSHRLPSANARFDDAVRALAFGLISCAAGVVDIATKYRKKLVLGRCCSFPVANPCLLQYRNAAPSRAVSQSNTCFSPCDVIRCLRPEGIYPVCACRGRNPMIHSSAYRDSRCGPYSCSNREIRKPSAVIRPATRSRRHVMTAMTYSWRPAQAAIRARPFDEGNAPSRYE